MDESEKIINDQFNALPESLRNAINATPWNEVVRKIVQDELLNEDQATSLETEAMLVMYGLESGDDLALNISNSLSVEPTVAEKITSRIKNEIFLPIINLANKPEEGDTLDKAASFPSFKMETLSELKEIEPPAQEPLLEAPQEEIHSEPVETPKIEEVTPEVKALEIEGAPQMVVAPTAKKIINILDTPEYATPKPPAEVHLVAMTEAEKMGDSLSPMPGFVPKTEIRTTPSPSSPVFPPREAPKLVTPPNPHYAGGVDPYREPLV